MANEYNSVLIFYNEAITIFIDSAHSRAHMRNMVKWINVFDESFIFYFFYFFKLFRILGLKRRSSLQT